MNSTSSWEECPKTCGCVLTPTNSSNHLFPNILLNGILLLHLSIPWQFGFLCFQYTSGACFALCLRYELSMLESVCTRARTIICPCGEEYACAVAESMAPGSCQLLVSGHFSRFLVFLFVSWTIIRGSSCLKTSSIVAMLTLSEIHILHTHTGPSLN